MTKVIDHFLSTIKKLIWQHKNYTSWSNYYESIN